MSRLTSYVALEKRLLGDPDLRDMGHAIHEAGIAPNTAAGISMALGGLAQFWATADDHADGDAVMRVNRSDLSERLGFDLIAFMPPNWLEEISPGHYRLPDFWEKNGRAGKARLEGATRKRESRARLSDSTSQKSVTKKKPARDSTSQKSVTSEQSEQSEHTQQSGQVTQESGRRARESHMQLTVTEIAQGGRFIDLYPKHAGALERERVMHAAAQATRQRLARWPELLDGAHRYSAFVKSTGREGTQFVKSPLRFIEEALYREQWAIPAAPSQEQNDSCERVLQLIGAVGAS